MGSKTLYTILNLGSSNSPQRLQAPQLRRQFRNGRVGDPKRKRPRERPHLPTNAPLCLPHSPCTPEHSRKFCPGCWPLASLRCSTPCMHAAHASHMHATVVENARCSPLKALFGARICMHRTYVCMHAHIHMKGRHAKGAYQWAARG